MNFFSDRCECDFAYYCIQWGKGCYFDFNCLPCKQAKGVLYDYSGNISALQTTEEASIRHNNQINLPQNKC